MRKEHPPAAVAGEAQLIEDLPDFQFLRLSVLIALAHHLTELLPFVSDHLPAAEAPHWNDHQCWMYLLYDAQCCIANLVCRQLQNKR